MVKIKKCKCWFLAVQEDKNEAKAVNYGKTWKIILNKLLHIIKHHSPVAWLLFLFLFILETLHLPRNIC